MTVNGSCCLGNARAKLPINSAARSVEAWVKPSDTYQRWLAGWGSSAVDRSFNVGVQGDGILVSAYGDDLSFTAPSSIADGLWHHVVVTYSAGVATAYLDGVKVGAQSFQHPLNTAGTTTGLRLGSTHDGSGAYYGVLDEVAVYQTRAHGGSGHRALPGGHPVSRHATDLPRRRLMTATVLAAGSAAARDRRRCVARRGHDGQRERGG